MNTVRRDFLRVALLAISMVCIALPAYSADVRAALEAANVKFSAAVAKGDSAALAALYTHDAQLLPAGSDILQGTQAIQQFWQAGIDSGISGMKLTTVEVFAHGPTATEVGQYELRNKAGTVIDRGKYIVVWRQESGKWKLLRDMFSTNTPPAKN